MFERLGWATDSGKGFCAGVQNFEHGILLGSSRVEHCTDNLYNSAPESDRSFAILTLTDHGVWCTD